MEIWLLRHAEAEEKSATRRDADRRLTADGRRRMELVARAIRALEPKFDLLLTSPLVRAKETLAPVARALEGEKLIEESDALLPEADPEKVLSEIGERGSKRALLVGHNPHMSLLLGLLVTGKSGVELEMKKAGIACFESEGAGVVKAPARLRFLLPPRVLEKVYAKGEG